MDKKQMMEEIYPLLHQINSPEDLKAIPQEQIPQLTDEIRDFLIKRILKNGGHLASNLGAVELTLAIHRVFSTPKDHLIFDVGHQSYVHKLITGRRDQFDSLRKGGGLSGFPKRSESEHDCFGTGHSSTSLSAALGFAEADRMAGSDAYTVCVLGDGAYTGGMIHEALNNCRRKLNLIIILNENEMSISKNIGRFARSLSKLRSTKGYFKTKSVTLTVLQHLPLVGKPLSNLLVRVKVGLKAALYGSNYFENLGLRYFGPVDGNNEAAVERLLEEAKESGQSCVIHVKTKKGKGYAPAEANPDQYHGLAPANAPTFTDPGFSEEMGAWLTAYAYKNEKVCAITAAMAGGTGLNKFRSAYPSRFFDVGIAEEHAVTFAAGLAANGFRPVVAIYSSFLQRAYDNLIHDVALQNLPVIFCVDRAGLNASDGATHHGIFDVAFLAQIPNMRLYAPVTRAGIGVAMEQAFKQNGPVAIRYPNGHEDSAVAEAFYGDSKPTEIGVRQWLPDGEKRSPEALIVTHGRIVKEALKAANALEKEGIRTGVLLLEQLCPYQETAQKLLSYLPEEPCKLLFLEEEIYAGGMGMMLSDTLRPYDVMKNKTVSVLALPEGFGIQDRAEPIWHSFGLDAEGIVKRILSL